MAQRIEERVRERLEEAMKSEDVQRQIEARLREERAALEQKASHSVLKFFTVLLLDCKREMHFLTTARSEACVCSS